MTDFLKEDGWLSKTEPHCERPSVISAMRILMRRLEEGVVVYNASGIGRGKAARYVIKGSELDLE